MIACVAERSLRSWLAHWAFMATVTCVLLWAADETYQYVIAVSVGLCAAVGQTVQWRLARREDTAPRWPADPD